MSETKKDRTERNTTGKNMQQTKKKDRKRETTITHYRNSKKTDRDGETAQKRKKERVCVCVTENRVRQKARERQ